MQLGFGRMILRYWTTFLLAFIAIAVQAQNQIDTEVTIRKARGQISLDGILDEEDWLIADKACNFWLNFPVDTAGATFGTEARLLFDDNFLYVAFKVEAPRDSYIVSSLRRAPRAPCVADHAWAASPV